MPRQFRSRIALPFLASIALLALTAPVMAGASWIEVRTPNFTVIGTIGAREARKIALQFEGFRAVFDRLTDGAIRRSADALASGRRAIELGSSSAFTHYLLAQLTLQTAPGEVDQAEQWLDRSITLDPGLAPAHWTLAHVHLAKGKPAAGALRLATTSIALAPRQAEGYLATGLALLREGRAQEATQFGEQALRLARDDDTRARAQDFLREARRAARPREGG